MVRFRNGSKRKKTIDKVWLTVDLTPGRNGIFSFQNVDLLSLLQKSPEFENIIDISKYVYVDGYLVLNSPQCIEYRQGKLHIKKRVLKDPSQYCLGRYDIYIGRGGRQKCYKPKWNTPNRIEVTSKCHPFYSDPDKKKTVYVNAKQITSFQEVTAENVADFIGLQGGPGEDFGAALIRYTKITGISIERLEELTGLSSKTIQRMRNSEDRPALRSVIAICLALKLSQWDSLYLLRLAGYELTTRMEDRIFWAILMKTEENTVAECNRMLERLGYKPLTKL